MPLSDLTLRAASSATNIEVTAPCALLPGESLEIAPTAAWQAAGPVGGSMALHARPSAFVPGSLLLTNYRLLWAPLEPTDGAGDPMPPASIGLQAMDRIRKAKANGSVSGATESDVLLEFFEKQGAWPSLCVRVAATNEAALLAAVRAHTRIPAVPTDARANVERSFTTLHFGALASEGSRPSDAPSWTAWTGYDAEAEFHRQGLNNPLSHWRVSRANADFDLCGSYPPLLIVPRCLSDDFLHRAAAFRSGRRLPVLCWKDAYGVASICRCAQPMVGVSKARSAEDEELLQAISPHSHDLLHT